MNERSPITVDDETYHLAAVKARELFEICDKQGRGFITKKQMHLLAQELPNFGVQEIEQVFDRLDADHNGSLTMDEFVDGFGIRFINYIV